MTRAIGTLFAASILLMFSETAWATGSLCWTCSATPTCSQPTATGTDACGTCTATLTLVCNASAPAVCDSPTPGTWSVCGGVCVIAAVPCGWTPYGYAIPGDPVYGFSQVCNGTNNPLYPDPYTTKPLVGFAAKGNIIVGDYTSDSFKSAVLPKLMSVTKPYVIDSTDVNLGYNNAFPPDTSGRPKFDGNYDQLDGGDKMNLDGTWALDAAGNRIPRKFYESSLPDATFRALVDPLLTDHDSTKTAAIEGVFFTNHAFAGLVNAGFFLIDGSMVSRDDGLIFANELRIMHDIRLFNLKSQKLSLPFEIKPPKLMQWQECSPACPPPPASF